MKPAIEQCRKAGINVCVITGDHHKTGWEKFSPVLRINHLAFGIACSLGILKEYELDHVIRGPDLENKSDQELANMQPFPTVFARVSPENKLKIIRALKLRYYTHLCSGIFTYISGEVCAMMGDGVNVTSLHHFYVLRTHPQFEKLILESPWESEPRS